MTSISHCGDREVDVGVLARQGFHHDPPLTERGIPGDPDAGETGNSRD